MVKVSIEVRSGAARFDVGVQAKSLQRAIDLVAGQYPKGAIPVKFPIEPEAFLVRDPVASARIVGRKQTYQEAA